MAAAGHKALLVTAVTLIAALSPHKAVNQTLPQSEDTMALPREDETAAGFRAWVADYRDTALAAGISAATYDREMRLAEFLPDVIRRDRNQSEFTKTIWDYLDIAVSDQRVEMGQAALARHSADLMRIEADFGVRKEIVLAVWGLETSYGTFRGDTDTISALATLAYDGRRAAFFGAQLLQALKILQGDHVSRADMRGSWAGAMGHTQFMPTSWGDFAVDYDGDGRRDLWSDDPLDALASAANYLAKNGYAKGAPWGLEITLPKGFDYDQSSERVRKSVADWRAMGVQAADGSALPKGDAASVLLPAGARGAAFLIYPNFRAIESYNPADAYVIAIGHLADRIAGGPPIKASWPREWNALGGDERRELQALLTGAGFDAGGVDGRIGPKTVAAVKAWQRSKGLIPDGYASPDVLAALRPAQD